MTTLQLRGPSRKAGFVASTASGDDAEPKHHFFVSSMATWRTGYDLGDLIASMQREPYPFNVWMVPGAKEAEYNIVRYAPEVVGAQCLAFYAPDGRR